MKFRNIVLRVIAPLGPRPDCLYFAYGTLYKQRLAYSRMVRRLSDFSCLIIGRNLDVTISITRALKLNSVVLYSWLSPYKYDNRWSWA